MSFFGNLILFFKINVLIIIASNVYIIFCALPTGLLFLIIILVATGSNEKCEFVL